MRFVLLSLLALAVLAAVPEHDLSSSEAFLFDEEHPPTGPQVAAVNAAQAANTAEYNTLSAGLTGNAKTAAQRTNTAIQSDVADFKSDAFAANVLSDKTQLNKQYVEGDIKLALDRLDDRSTPSLYGITVAEATARGIRAISQMTPQSIGTVVQIFGPTIIKKMEKDHPNVALRLAEINQKKILMTPDEAAYIATYACPQLRGPNDMQRWIGNIKQADYDLTRFAKNLPGSTSGPALKSALIPAWSDDELAKFLGATVDLRDCSFTHAKCSGKYEVRPFQWGACDAWVSTHPQPPNCDYNTDFTPANDCQKDQEKDKCKQWFNDLTDSACAGAGFPPNPDTYKFTAPLPPGETVLVNLKPSVTSPGLFVSVDDKGTVSIALPIGKTIEKFAEATPATTCGTATWAWGAAASVYINPACPKTNLGMRDSRTQGAQLVYQDSLLQDVTVTQAALDTLQVHIGVRLGLRHLTTNIAEVSGANAGICFGKTLAGLQDNDDSDFMPLTRREPAIPDLLSPKKVGKFLQLLADSNPASVVARSGCALLGVLAASIAAKASTIKAEAGGCGKPGVTLNEAVANFQRDEIPSSFKD